MLRSHDDKVKELLGRMTTEEKLGQVQQLTWTGDTGPGGGQTKEIEALARAGRLGSVLNLHGAKWTNDLQRLAVEESRLGIPLLFGFDVIHGFWTTFPIPLAQASAFDPAVAETDARVSAAETRSQGVRWTFSPMMDVTNEPRWGRIAESSGEDPYLNAVLAVAKVRGYQGPADGSGLRSGEHVAACAKHFVAYGGAEGGRDYNTVDLSEQRLRNHYLPPFKAALDAGAATVMAAFNTVGGVPAHANSHTMNSILKGEWDFDGFVVSDYTGVMELVAHGYAEDPAHAAELALTHGLDMEMVSTHIADHGAELLDAGRISMERLDDAVTRILRLKYALGLFDDPYTDEAAEIAGPTAEARAAAREAAARSMVLLKNEGGVLPLKPGGTIAVVGPHADSADQHGTWAGPGRLVFDTVSVLDAVRAAAPGADVRHSGGGDPAMAAAAAWAADVTVVVVGEDSAISGEAASRSEIDLPAGQQQLIEAVAATGKPFVVVLVNGRPLTIGGWADRAPAVLEAWHAGIEAGNAVADILFGTVNPGGKLPVSFPRTVGQIPVYYNREATGRPYDEAEKYVSKYLDLPDGPQFVFGHGLSYTTFTTGAPELSRTEIAVDALERGETVEVTVPVANTGDLTGDEVVQLYIHDVAASVVQPVRRLRAFERVTLAPGEERRVRFTLGAEDLGFWTNDPAGTYVLERGRIDVYTGTSSAATVRGSLRLV
ncbi:glycoside hydrolase family 3 N-terminal domain-containing protein [Streptomyces drozdowiczii]|uniref:beta-glucosidase n=1 Tax=Streptomyces drozdowiczii TaxID=202862 RepID=A0ABY6PPU4_9ACTN|nr:glycoside hydrolase family 3 N-terminal domain-containing protein [Streptomyces drozdowiczii]MCX0246763.1 glycoside hydrolase family 3 C-terminal domain-containing protein [Streptomyces drozdowiczii]UZK53776.1 glycoside hydrolase family 3 C-terminal domain-containing protein [Streptomyces drozdowiczii]